jgi:hypothetical protein
MRFSSVLSLVLCFVPSLAAGQSSVGDAPESRITTLLGVGNSFGGIGVLADWRPFGRGPISFIASVGTTRAFFNVQPISEREPWNSGSPASVAAAVGVRANAGHGRHQGFLELAVLPVDDDVVKISAAQQRVKLLYGVGLQLGYRAHVTHDLHLNALVGGGYAINEAVIASRWKPIFGLGLGYAWR